MSFKSRRISRKLLGGTDSGKGYGVYNPFVRYSIDSSSFPIYSKESYDSENSLKEAKDKRLRKQAKLK